jgi:hypothetical protein
VVSFVDKTLISLIPFRALRVKARHRLALRHQMSRVELCSKYVERVVVNEECSWVQDGGEKSKIIWQCWLQGEENAPEVVKKCLRSARVNNPDYKQVVVNDENLFDYVEIPKFIIDKYRNGIVSKTHFSDILRVYLLAEHGGIWADATIYFSSSIPQSISSQQFFVFQDPLFPPTLISSWFIISDKNHPLIEILKSLLELYWEENSDLKEYFLLHYFFGAAVKNNGLCSDLYENIPFYSNVPPHYLQKFLLSHFSQSKVNKIFTQSFLHKLTYKERLLGIDML